MRTLCLRVLGLSALCACQSSVPALTPTEADIHVSPTELDFSDTVVHATVTKTINVENLGSAAGQVTVSAPVGPAASLYEVAPLGTFTLAGGAQATISVTYAPDVVSSYDRAAFAIQWPSTPAAITLKGSAGTAGLQITPDPLDFNFVDTCGDGRSLPLHIVNVGTLPIDLVSLSVDDGIDGGVPVFSVSPAAPGVIAPGQSIDALVTFTPHNAQKFHAQLVIVTSGDLEGSSTTFTSSITGYGGGAAIMCSPTTLDFGLACSGLTTTLPVICTNTGSAAWVAGTCSPSLLSISSIPLGICILTGPDAGTVPQGMSVQFDLTCDCRGYDGGFTIISTGSDGGTTTLGSGNCSC